jgi:hypothetical protein
MAEQDIREDQMTITNTVGYLRGLKGKDSVLVAPSSLMTQIGILHTSFSLSPGGQYELPYKSGLIMIQNSNRSHEKAVATLYGSGNGTVIVPSSTIQFFSEEIGKVCVFNNGENTKYIIKNTRNESQNLIITFIE